MDWNAAIEKNHEALKRILAALIAMAGMDSGGQFTFFPQKGAVPQGAALAEKSKLSPAPTLPRHLYRAVLRLLRPAEAAARRLVIVAARDLVVSSPRPRKPNVASPQARGPKSAFLRNGVGTGIILPRDFPLPAGLRPRPQRVLCLPLIDPLPRWRGPARPAASGVPRISFPGFSAPFPVPVRLPPSPRDPIDATRLGLRLQAVASALDDLPKHARRFARWKAARDAAGAQNKENHARGLTRRASPLRPGRPPGLNAANRRRPAHEVHEVLSDLQWFAFKALQRPDTS